MTPFSPRVGSPRTAALLVAGILAIASPSFAVAPVKLSGAITGQVRDGVGIPQMGATVLLFTHEDRLFARALTDENGAFSFLSLMPEVYSIRVTLRSFAPVFRNNIQVQPGMRSVLNVNLTTLFSTIQLVTPPEGERALMTDDWKWVLRSASSTRPILRILPNFDPDGDPGRPARHATAVFRAPMADYAHMPDVAINPRDDSDWQVPRNHDRALFNVKLDKRGEPRRIEQALSAADAINIHSGRQHRVAQLLTVGRARHAHVAFGEPAEHCI